MMDVAFLTQLVTQPAPKEIPAPWLDGGASRWMLVRDFALELDETPYTVPAGYIFNGSSIPWWLWWMFPPTYAPAWKASAFHDFCYSHLYHDVTKQFADDAFRDIMLEDGAEPWIANKFHWAVSRFGRGGW